MKRNAKGRCRLTMGEKSLLAKASTWEKAVLAVLLLELRRSVKAGEQLQVHFDPYVDGSGASVFSGLSATGRTWEIDR